jgi:hypothetical protein
MSNNKTNRKGTIMKKLYTTLMMAMMAMMTLSFTSCETDEEIARGLEGTWMGNMHVKDDFGVETVYSEITFTRYSSYDTSGAGVWYDYYADNYRKTTHFKWRVDWTNIYILFENNVEVEIRNYDLRANLFTGRFWDGDKEVSFKLERVGGHYYTRGETEDKYIEAPAEVHPTHHRIK